MMFSYFLLSTVKQKALIAANNDLIKRSDELWVFGEISSGVGKEIKLAEKLQMPIHYFKICTKLGSFIKVNSTNVRVESN